MKFKKKPVVVEAVQWFKMGDHPAVESREPEIIFDKHENYYYVSHCDHDVEPPKTWLAVNPNSEVAVKNGASLPFAFYEIKSGKRVPASDPSVADSENGNLFGLYANYSKWNKVPGIFGWIKTLEGGHIVTPGDWIITGVSGEHYPCKPDIFEKTYEKVEEDK